MAASPASQPLPRATRDVVRLKRDLDAFGYCLIEGALAPETAAAVRARLAEQAEAERRHGHHRMSQVQDSAGANQWVNMLLNKGRVFRELLFRPQVSAVVEHLLGPHHLLSDISAHLTRPGNSLLPLHIDQWWMPPPALPGEPYVRAGAVSRDKVQTGPLAVSAVPITPPLVVNAMFMISDFTEANGATRMVPRSHLSGSQPAPDVPHPVPTVPLVGPAGTVAVWEGRTWHAAGANLGNETRYGITTYYGAPQIRSLQNHTLGTKPEVLEAASPELLELLGFRVWNEYGKTGDIGSDVARPAEMLIGEMRP